MRKRQSDAELEDQLTLEVDSEGRIILSDRIRDQLGIEPNDELTASRRVRPRSPLEIGFEAGNGDSGP